MLKLATVHAMSNGSYTRNYVIIRLPSLMTASV